MLCPDHTGSPGGKVRRVENICGRGGERELSPSGLGRDVSCRGLAVSLFREFLPLGELPWLWRDTGYLEPQRWEHGRGPKVKVFLSGGPAVSADSYPWPPSWWSYPHPRMLPGPTLQLKRPEEEAAAAASQIPHVLLSLFPSQGNGDLAPLSVSGSSLETCSHLSAPG